MAGVCAGDAGYTIAPPLKDRPMSRSGDALPLDAPTDPESEAAMQVDALFNKFDTDNDGTISRTEFEIALRALNVHPEQHKSVNKIDESS